MIREAGNKQNRPNKLNYLKRTKNSSLGSRITTDTIQTQKSIHILNSKSSKFFLIYISIIFNILYV